MASVKLPELAVAAEPPRKRQKLSPSRAEHNSTPHADSNGDAHMETQTTQTVVSDTGFQPEREAQVGILHFVNSSNLGFSGVLKQRYTDFLVNEITPDGNVVHLTDDKAPVFRRGTKVDVVQEPRHGVEANDVQITEADDDKQTITAKVEKADEILSTGPPESKPDSNSPLPSSVTTDVTKINDATSPSSIEFKTHANLSAASANTTIQSVNETVAISTEEPLKRIDKPAFVISPEDDGLLTNYFGIKLKDELLKLHENILSKPSAKPSVFGSLLSDPITDRQFRGRVHHNVRRIFESRIETESIDDGKIRITAASMAQRHPESKRLPDNPRQRNPRNQPKGKLGWQELGGQFLHFSLYKENKDTMEIISYLCRSLKIKPRDFAFAGTKDRRAVTVQRVSVWRQYAEDLSRMNKVLRNARLGDFKHEKHRLELGELEGNQFTITLRDCRFGDDSALDNATRIQLADSVVGQAVKHLQDHGFLNYFGLQRFGTFAIGTDEIGKKILKDDFEGAVKAILTYSDEALAVAMDPNSDNWNGKLIGRDDIDRAYAIHHFRTTGKGHIALDKLPRKFSAELAIIRHLSSNNHSTDYVGAILCVSRNLRTMYVHAYQSLVWNFAATERWVRYGNQVVKGDLVLIDGQGVKPINEDEVDENGEIVIHPAADDVALSQDDIFQRARPLTTEEAASGQYSVFDIVLPTPGYDIQYPDNDIGDFYKEFMSSERGGGLDPANMRRKQKDFSLSGSYRKVLAQVGKDLSFEIKSYHEELEQLVETDLEKLERSRSMDNRRSNNQNARYQNGTQSNRGGRYNDIRDGRDNGSFRNKQASRRVDDKNAAQQTNQEYPTHYGTPQHNAWLDLPATLAADDRAAAEAYEIQKRSETPLKNKDVKQPIFKDTFIETSADNEGRRTGYRSTTTIGANAAMEESPSKNESVTPAVPDSANASVSLHSAHINAASQSQNDSLDSSGSLEDSQDGGALVASLEPAKKRSVEELSTSSIVELPAAQSSVTKESAMTDMRQTLHPSNGTILTSTADQAPSNQAAKIAVIVKFALGSSQYATMALRELMKSGGVKTYKPDFSSGR